MHYNKYHPQLLGMVLERTTGMSVTQYLQTRIWDPIGMEFGGSWSIDSLESNFEKMETGVNARAIDFAKFGVLFLNDGNWQGKQVISKEWVKESTQPWFPTDCKKYYMYSSDIPEFGLGTGYYKYMWSGRTREQGIYDFLGQGDRGQFVYISPFKKLVIVRNGIDFGISTYKWRELFYNFATQF